MSRFKCEVITFTPYNILKKGLDYKMNFYNNLVLKADPTEDNHVIKKKNLHEALWEEKQRTIVDSEAYYSLETDSTLEGVKQVVTTITDADKQILLTSVNTQTTPVDLTGLVGDGSEYVLYHDEVVHEEEYEETIYLPRSEAPEGSTLMTIQRLNEIWGTVKILDYKQS